MVKTFFLDNNCNVNNNLCRLITIFINLSVSNMSLTLKRKPWACYKFDMSMLFGHKNQKLFPILF